MLFPYNSVTGHKFEKLHGFIDCIFHDAWCKAKTTEYSIDLFKSNSELYQLLYDIYQHDMAGTLKKNSSAKNFYEQINDIFNAFKRLPDADIIEYRNQFTWNNNIEQLCDGDAVCIPTRYTELNTSHPELNKSLEDFFSNLYSKGFIELSDTKYMIGTKTEYYRDFVTANDNGICPFCGLYPIDGEYDPTRDAFDHYLPKSKYPFNSVSIKNLAPSCSKCNSGYKGDKDPLHDSSGIRRKAFYPFAEQPSDIEISVSVNSKNWKALTPSLIDISLTSLTTPDQVDTWNQLFKLDQRYSAKCCSKNGAKAWLNRIFIECDNYGIKPEKMLEGEIQSAKDNPWFEASFLKKSFLEGCDRAGLFDAK